MAVEVEKKAVDLGLLEEDDIFEEFPAETNEKEDENDQHDVNVWEDNWDDDAVEDDFSVQLSTYSRKRPHSHSPPLRSPEPLAKKMCSRATPPASPSRSRNSTRATNNNANSKNGVNGHSNGHSKPNTNSESTAEEQQESPTSTTSGRGRRRGGSSTSSREDSSEPRSTRSSARLRSSRK